MGDPYAHIVLENPKPPPRKIIGDGKIIREKIAVAKKQRLIRIMKELKIKEAEERKKELERRKTQSPKRQRRTSHFSTADESSDEESFSEGEENQEEEGKHCE